MQIVAHIQPVSELHSQFQICVYKLHILNIDVISYYSTAVYTECEVNVCENGGICKKLGSSYICECTNGYSGVNCETG